VVVNTDDHDPVVGEKWRLAVDGVAEAELS
jgi:hypothetical protein